MANLTARFPNLAATGPTLDVQFALPDDTASSVLSAGRTVPTPVSATALVDTGASHTAVRQDIPHALGLRAVGQIAVSTPSAANGVYSRYFVRVALPNSLFWEGLVVAVPMPMPEVECLIGRDILAHGVFVYLGQENLFTLSF